MMAECDANRRPLKASVCPAFTSSFENDPLSFVRDISVAYSITKPFLNGHTQRTKDQQFSSVDGIGANRGSQQSSYDYDCQGSPRSSNTSIESMFSSSKWLALKPRDLTRSFVPRRTFISERTAHLKKVTADVSAGTPFLVVHLLTHRSGTGREHSTSIDENQTTIIFAT